jgi:hypothetical protein
MLLFNQKADEFFIRPAFLSRADSCNLAQVSLCHVAIYEFNH